ncbi:hypothetical protein [Synechococcus elongatus]|uniref:Uncharacterized protein n=1 Tax=Synechococcus elongatus PCC 11802 TaxID=2283154 RepID=A0AAT9JV11_SYNEL|nr:hypothetical protein [Synechococcus elongatus]QFZ92940.1 hypothetical protein EKO22_11980 [Synechococcus elongatus PCC 11802]
MRFHLRSRSGEEIVLYLRPGNPAAPIEMAGPANLCGTVSTLLKMSLTGLSATSEDLLSLCEYDPVFRHWFRLEAVVKDGEPDPAQREDAKFAAMEPIYPSQVAAMRLGERLIAASLVTKEQLDEALKGIQEQMPHLQVGEILCGRGYLRHKTMEFFLNPVTQMNTAFLTLRLGERLQAAGVVDDRDVHRALQCQQWLPLSLGRLLVLNGSVSQATADFFGRLTIEPTDLSLQA